MTTHFATLISSQFWIQETILQAKSLRTFGGDLADQPFTAFIPRGQILPPEIQPKADQLSIQIVEFSLPETARKFPLGFIPFGAAAAEAHLADQCDLLIWLLPDTLILAPPADFLLPADKALAYRPVHHKNIGSEIDKQPDTFWQQIYSHTETPKDRLFKMVTCYREEVRPYFNAGLLAVRPEMSLLHQWAEVFERTFQHKDFTPFYEDQRYSIFMHQAILAGVILNQLSPDELFCLPESYNYPLHMHTGYPPEGKITHLSDLITARYENTLELPEFTQPFVDKETILTLLE